MTDLDSCEEKVSLWPGETKISRMGSLRRRISSFAFLNITQFLGALNDNIFKLLIVFLLIAKLGAIHSNIILALAGFFFVLPFILFSIPSGTLADRFSKRNITVWTKVMETVVMILGVVAFSFESSWASYTVLFFMGAQSAIFGPSKYGIVPELVGPDKIASANGILTAFTVFATILGTFLASFLTQITGHRFVLSALFCVLIAVVGLGASLGIQKTPAVGTKRKIRANLVAEIYRVLHRAKSENYLLSSLLGSAYFFLIGAYIQLNILTFAIQSLGLTDVQGGYLFLTCAFGIAVGAYIAGKISGTQVELGISPIAGVGIAVLLFVLYPIRSHLIPTTIDLFLLGTCGGMYLVPFDAYIQAASPERHRGENVAGGNFLSFVGVLIATGILALLGSVLTLSAAEGFVIMGLLSLIVALAYVYRLSDTFVRLASRWKLRGKRRPLIEGRECLPPELPSVIMWGGQDWKSALTVLSVLQQRYTRLLIERPDNLSRRDKSLCRLAKALFFHATPKENSLAIASIQKWLRQGFDVTVITQSKPTHTLIHAISKAITAEDISINTSIIYASLSFSSFPYTGSLKPINADYDESFKVTD